MTPEGEIQKAVFDELKARKFPDAVAWHTPNDRTSRRKAGYLAGVADVCVVHKGKFYAMELKAPKRRPTEDQLEFRDNINRAGGYAFVAEGLQEALCCLELWGILRPEGRA